LLREPLAIGLYRLVAVVLVQQLEMRVTLTKPNLKANRLVGFEKIKLVTRLTTALGLWTKQLSDANSMSFQ